MSLYSLKQRQYSIVGIIIVLGLFILYALRNFFTAILGALIIYTLFRPFFLQLTKRWKLSKSLSASIVMIISFIIIIMPFIFFSWMIINKILSFQKHPEKIAEIVKRINEFAGTQLHRPEFVETAFNNLQNWALSIFPSAIGEVLGVFLAITVMYFILYFMLVDYKIFEKTLLKYLPFKKRNALRFAKELKYITYSNLVGQGLIALTQGSLVGIGFLIFGISDAFFWGVISTLLSFLPVIGTPIIFVPAGIIAISTNNTFGGIGIIIWGLLLVINIDNIMRLLIAKKVANIHPLITVIGVVIGIPIFGILGVVIGPLLLSYFILIVKIYENKHQNHNTVNDGSVNEII